MWLCLNVVFDDIFLHGERQYSLCVSLVFAASVITSVLMYWAPTVPWHWAKHPLKFQSTPMSLSPLSCRPAALDHLATSKQVHPHLACKVHWCFTPRSGWYAFIAGWAWAGNSMRTGVIWTETWISPFWPVWVGLRNIRPKANLTHPARQNVSRKKPAGSKIDGTCFHCLVLSWIAAGVVGTVCIYKMEAGRKTDSGPSVIERREEMRDDWDGPECWEKQTLCLVA